MSERDPRQDVEGKEPVAEESRAEAADPAEELPKEDLKDLGFGAKVATESRGRLLNRDGSFNVERRGLSFLQSLSVYQGMIRMPWWQFYLFCLLGYLSVNLLFTVVYALAGPETISGMGGSGFGERFLEAFFFSVQTITTVGYGTLHPVGLGANLLVAAEAFIGLFGFAVAAALMFARLSRPTANIIFSQDAIVAPYRDMTALMFRIANARKNQLLDVEARVLFSHFESVEGRRTRRFDELRLERHKVVFLPLHWTVVHPIDESSPLYGLDEADLRRKEVEILILIKGIDETFSETIYARSSYLHDEVLWHRRFRSIFHDAGGGKLAVDLRELSETDPVDVETAA